MIAKRVQRVIIILFFFLSFMHSPFVFFFFFLVSHGDGLLLGLFVSLLLVHPHAVLLYEID